MKSLLLIVISAILITSCGNSSTPGPTEQPGDTAITLSGIWTARNGLRLEDGSTTYREARITFSGTSFTIDFSEVAPVYKDATVRPAVIDTYITQYDTEYNVHLDTMSRGACSHSQFTTDTDAAMDTLYSQCQIADKGFPVEYVIADRLCLRNVAILHDKWDRGILTTDQFSAQSEAERTNRDAKQADSAERYKTSVTGTYTATSTAFSGTDSIGNAVTGTLSATGILYSDTIYNLSFSFARP